MSKKEKSCIIIQKNFRRYINRKKYQKFRNSQPSFKKLIERKNLIFELVSSERVYVKNLRFIQNDYLLPLLNLCDDPFEVALIEKEELNKIFHDSIIKQILNLHEQLLENLEIELKKWPLDCKVVDRMINLAPFLKLYTPYISDNKNAQEVLINNIKKNPSLIEFLKKKKAKTNNLELSAFLIMPVQRIPRYILFFKGLLKNCIPRSEEFKKITISLMLLTGVTEHINIEKRRARLVKEQHYSFNEIVVPHRKFNLQMEKVVISGKNSKGIESKGSFTIQLFNDLFLFFRYNNKKNVKNHIVGCVYLVFSKITDVNANTFKIYYRDIVFSVTIPNAQEKKKCYEEIMDFIKELNEKSVKRGIEDPKKLLEYRDLILSDLIITKRKIESKKRHVNELYEKYEMFKEKKEQKKKEKDSPRKQKVKPQSKKKGFFSIFNSARKINVEDEIDNLIGPQKVKRYSTLEEIDRHEIMIKKQFNKKKSMEKHLKKLQYTLELCHSMIKFLMGDGRFLENFPYPETELEIDKKKRVLKLEKDIFLFKKMFLTFAQKSSDALDFHYMIEKSLTDEKLEMDHDFSEEFEEVIKTKFRYTKKRTGKK